MNAEKAIVGKAILGKEDNYGGGLTSGAAGEFLQKYGKNALPEKKKNFSRKFLAWVISPVSVMLIAAAILSLLNGSNTDFFIITVLFLSNFLISVWHEGKADKSIKKLQQNLLFKVKTLRDGVWQFIDSDLLVPGDIAVLSLGNVVPADMKLLQVSNVSINESVLTGESLPKEKKADELAYSGSFVITGQAIGKVVATGKNSQFGRTVTLGDSAPRKSSLEKDIISISRFISTISVIIVIILTLVLLSAKAQIGDILTLDLSLLIAGIPVALPTVMSLIISVGILDLAKRKAIVRRLASLEDLSNVDMLLSDKTGTLTQNKISVEKIIPFGAYNENQVIKYALSTIADTVTNPLEHAVEDKAKEQGIEPYKKESIIPGDSERKRSTAVIFVDNKKQTVSAGAAQIVASLCAIDQKLGQQFEEIVKQAAAAGYRTHVVAVNLSGEKEEGMQLVGVMYMADKVHKDAKDTIAFMNKHGIGVKMVTGDNYEISKRVAGDLGLKGQIYERYYLDTKKDFIQDHFEEIAGFAEVLPKDKYELVQMARKNHMVAVTGDGINDLPAVKTADVGFAVSSAVDALKSTADIVLLSNGISVIKDAIIEARKIFTRLYNYSLYRISESFRLIVTIAVIGLIFKTYPLTPVQIIILAFLNDIPIISLAFDRVKNSIKPAHVDAKKRFVLSSLFGLAGVANSLLLLYIMIAFLHLSWPVVQTMFFLKLTVSGHMLVYVAHTTEKWFKFLPSKQVIWSTTITQLIATLFSFFGLFTAPISVGLIVLVWVWSFVWMQISDSMKFLTTEVSPR